MQPSDSHTDFKVRLENRSTRDRHMGLALLKLILHIRALPYRQLSLALFTVHSIVLRVASVKMWWLFQVLPNVTH